jgi:hypothetical protein
VISFNYLIPLLTILGSAVSAWIAMRVAQAENRHEIKAIQREYAELMRRLERLEDIYFRKDQ